jgi:hypothetical protein
MVVTVDLPPLDGHYGPAILCHVEHGGNVTEPASLAVSERVSTLDRTGTNEGAGLIDPFRAAEILSSIR